MNPEEPKPCLAELAGPDPLGLQYFASCDTPSLILRTEGASGRLTRDIHDLYTEMEDKDAHLCALLQTRRNGVLARPRKIMPASPTPSDLEISDFVKQTLEGIPSFEQSLSALLDAVGRGFAVLEILWKTDDGAIRIEALRPRSQRRFTITPGGGLLLKPDPLSSCASPSSSSARRGAPAISPACSPRPYPHPDTCHNPANGTALPPRKFLVLTFNATDERPEGLGLLARAYWYYWFKKNNLKFWVLYNEKFGSPTVVGKFRPGTGEEERRRLLDVVSTLQNDTGVTIPETMTLEFLEARRSGGADTYRELADWCNDEMARLILGATLSTGEGRRSGSLALGKVHERVRAEYIESDAHALMDVINGRLIRWLVDFNFGPEFPAPRLAIDTTADEDLAEQIRIDQEMVKAGVPLPLSWFYERYRRPAPAPGEHALRYDDQNLYQYHLNYGVLTINEVRSTLGLPPVAWGDFPTGEAAGFRASADENVEEESSGVLKRQERGRDR